MSQQISQQAELVDSSMQDPRIGMPRPWLNMLTPQGQGPPLWTSSFLYIPLKSVGPDLMLFSLSSSYRLCCSFAFISLPVSIFP